MSILLLLIVPVLIGLFGLIFGKGDITWQEFLIQEGVVVVLIVMGFYLGVAGKMMDTEIWNGEVVSKGKVEKECSESYSCNCHSCMCDEDGCSTCCDTCYRYWDITKWEAWSSNGERVYSAGGCYNDLPFEPARHKQIIIGEPTAQEHKYKNYIKANQDTILKRVVTDKEFTIPEYPRVYDYYRVKRLIGVGYEAAIFSKEHNAKLDVINAELGAKKQVNITMLVVNESDQMYFEKLKEVWLGGKKNDFVVVIGAPEYPKISWVDVMSWSDSEDAKVFTKNRIMKLDEFCLDSVLNIIEEEVRTKYVRKEMADFEYLKARVEPSMKVQLIIGILGILSSIGLTIVFKHKDIA